MKGNYLISEGGFTANGIRALTGVPVFEYYSEEFESDTSDFEAMWNLLKDADSKNYIMSAGTLGDGDDTQRNDCGIAKSHAYAIMSVFTMK